MTLAASVLVACPTRHNPDLPDGWDTEVGDAEVDSDPDSDVDPDVEFDSDGIDCGANRQWCDGSCVPINSDESCGDCETKCDTTIEGCSCQRRGGETDDLNCWLVIAGHPTTWELCELD